MDSWISADPNANAAALKASNPQLSTADIHTYNINRTAYFKGTIAVCIVYALIAVAMLCIMVFTQQGSLLMTDSFRTFTITFVIGMLLVVILLVVQIVSYKPSVNTAPPPYDSSACPDYWTLQPYDDTNAKNSNNLTQVGANQGLTKYVCVPPDGNSLKRQGVNIINNGEYKRFSGNNVKTQPTDVARLLYGSYNLQTSDSTTKDKAFLDCNKVFPNYLAAMNAQDTKINDTPNALACEFSAQCGVPWTSMCPNSKN